MSARDDLLLALQRWAAEEPLLLAAAGFGLGVLALLAFIALIRLIAGRRTPESAPQPAPGPSPELARLAAMEQALGSVVAAQERASGALSQVAEAAARGQSETLRMLEQRLDAVGARLGEGLEASATTTARSLGALSERLDAIDRAQSNLEQLSSEMLGLQDILSDKQTRGVFGEMQMEELIRNALPPSAYAFQATLSNGRRADALLKLPHPPGPIAVDAKFPLGSYEALAQAERGPARDAAAKAFSRDVRTHIRAIAERYVVEGETADGALMFLPSEAVYAELHARFPEVVREGFEKRVWVVSPTTLMATLSSMRALLKDARLREEAQDLRVALAALGGDLRRVSERAGQLRTHFGQVEKDVAGIESAAETARRRLRRLDSDGLEGEATSPKLDAAADVLGVADDRESA